MNKGKWTFTPGVRVETINQEYCDDNTNCGTSTMQDEGTYLIFILLIIYRPIGTIQVGNIVTGVKKINLNALVF